MNVLKRIEVWLLLLAVGGVLFFVLRPGGRTASGGGAGPAGGGAHDPGRSAVTVTGRQLLRDYGNAKLSLRLELRNDGPDPLLVAPPEVRLTDGRGAEVPPFFLPFKERQEIPPGEQATVTQIYWLEAEHLEGELWLEAPGGREAIKDGAPFALDSIENQKAREFESETWN